MAKAIHLAGASYKAPFISVNCAALPDNLIESELIGVEKGAFTGAVATRKGTFELSDRGTLLLDEIGEMPIALQAKLLSALEDRRIKRIGGHTEREVNVRVIAATNAEPETSIKNGGFRRDLFYRLSVIRIHLRPLRERRDDIPSLCRHFLEQFAPGRGIKISQNEFGLLQSYDFPGNVRELRNIIERSLILQEGDFINPSRLIDLSSSAMELANPQLHFINPTAQQIPLAEMEKNFILDAFTKNNKNITLNRDSFGHFAFNYETKIERIRIKIRIDFRVIGCTIMCLEV